MNRFLLIVFILMTGCETIIDVDLPDVGTPLVVNSIINPDSTLEVELTSALSFTAVSTTEINPPVTVAEIAVWEDGDLLPIAFNHTNRGNFISSFTPQTGKSYRIQVVSEGFDTVEGEATIPPALQITTIRIDQGEFEYTSGLEFHISIQDDPNQSNFYGLFGQSTVEIFDTTTGESIDKHTFPVSMSTTDLVLADQDFLEEAGEDRTFFREVFFPDDLFQGRTHELSFSVDGISINFPGSNFRTETELQIQLLSVSEDLYRYKRAAKLQRELGDDPFSEPVEIPSNMSNGVGLFAGYQAEVITVSPDSIVVLNNR